MDLHPIMYVPDQYAERDFYRLLGFEDVYEGDEFPGFLAIRHGAAVLGLQRCGDDHPRYREGLRWQFEVDTVAELDEIVTVCRRESLQYDEQSERGGDRFLTRLVRVVSPAGVQVWFEGPNEAI